MADGVVSSGVSSHVLPKSRSNINEYVCTKYRVYETQLKGVLDELGSARIITDFLEKELLTTTATKNTHGHNLDSTEGFLTLILEERR